MKIKILQEYLKRISVKNIYIIGILLSLMIRFLCRDYISLDMSKCLIPWYEEIKCNGGIHGLGQQVGDYGLLYQTLISIMTYIDLNPLYLYKILSVVFDFIAALFVALIYNDYLRESNRFIYKKHLVGCSFVVFLLIPTVFMNSAYWGQCDSMYSSMCLGTLYFIKREKYIPAFIFLGIAFACKLQTIFIIPFLLYYYLKFCKKYTIVFSVFAIVVFWLSGFVAFIYGRNLLEPFDLYVQQTGLYNYLWLLFPSFWGILGKYAYNNFEIFKTIAIIATLLMCIIGIVVFIKAKIVNNSKNYYLIAAWFVWTIVGLLPSMHERYAYLLDSLLLILYFIDRRYFKYCFWAILISFVGYCQFLYKLHPLTPLKSFIYLILYISYCKDVLREIKRIR